jgi:hypothetical protein
MLLSCFLHCGLSGIRSFSSCDEPWVKRTASEGVVIEIALLLSPRDLIIRVKRISHSGALNTLLKCVAVSAVDIRDIIRVEEGSPTCRVEGPKPSRASLRSVDVFSFKIPVEQAPSALSDFGRRAAIDNPNRHCLVILIADHILRLQRVANPSCLEVALCHILIIKRIVFCVAAVHSL